MIRKKPKLPHNVASERPLSFVQPKSFNRQAALQPKIAGAEQQQQRQPAASQPVRQPVAPPVYRPQPVPKVLQTKMASGQRPQSSQTVRQPVAPPVYRPEPKKIVQPKMAVTAHSSKQTKQPGAPPVYRPQPAPMVLQAKNSKIVAPTPAPHQRGNATSGIQKNPAPAKPTAAIQPKGAMTPKPSGLSPTRQGAASPVSPFPLPGIRGGARFGGNVLQRMEDENNNNLPDYGEDEGVQEGVEMPGMDSNAIYRVMPEFEWEKTNATGTPETGTGHFWSPTLSYVTDYLKKCGKDTTSVIIVKIPLSVPYLQFLKVVQSNKQLHAHNFGKAWNTYFGKTNKGKNGMAISLKNDGGTPTITFKSLPEEIKAMLGKPELVNG